MSYVVRALLAASMLVTRFVAASAQSTHPSPEQEKLIQSVQVDAVAAASDRLYRIDSLMQKNYAKTQHDVGQMQSPVILAMFNDKGGKYILRRGGKEVSVEPVPAIYRQIKSVSHTVVGIFEIVSPYFAYPESENWRATLSEYNKFTKDALATLSKAGMPAEIENNCRLIMRGGIAFMDKVLENGTCSAADYSEYAMSLLPTLMKNVNLAGKLQVDHFEAVVKQWRKEMGEEEWSRLYAVVNTAWAMRGKNVHFGILAQMMEQDTVNHRLIMAESMKDVTEDDLFSLLGRIVNDRVLSILVFNKTYRMDVELMGEAAGAAIEEAGAATEEAAHAACPHFNAWKNKMLNDDHEMPNQSVDAPIFP